jgi:PHD/YefM family antitoxin component YafN of YafNO toxin-antitoxin module
LFWNSEDVFSPTLFQKSAGFSSFFREILRGALYITLGLGLDLKRDIDSLSNFKRNTVRFLEQLRESGEPVVLTINGKAELVVQDAKSYQKLLDLAERVEAMEAIREGMKELDEGKGISLEEFREHVKRKHGIPL